MQFVDATTSDDDLQVALGIHALQILDLRRDTPSLTVIEPWGGRRDANPEWYATDFPGFSNDPAGDSNYFQDRDSYWLRSAMDHYERSEGESRAGRFDVTHNFDDGFLTAVKAGVRYAERNQVVRNTSYNWGSLGAEWAPGGGEGALWLSELDESIYDEFQYVDWSDFHRGGVVSIPGDGFIFPTEDLLKDVIAGRQLPQNNPNGEGIWEPYQNRPDVIPGTYFVPAEVYDTTETNEAIYVRLDFGSDEGAFRFNGNVGLRYVRLDRDAIGSVQFPDMIGQAIPAGAPTDLTDSGAIRKWAEDQVGPFDPGLFESEQDWLDEVTTLLSYSRDANNWLTPDEKAFGNDYDEGELESSAKWDDVLPSFNLKVELTDDLIGRFAVSKAIALPDMSEVRNQAVLGARGLNVTRVVPDPNAPALPGPVDSGVDIVSVDPAIWTGNGGNPALKPMESTQWDASLEWYFAPVGSLTGTVFYKDLKNFFIEGALPRTFTNPDTGVTQTVDFTTTRNGREGKLQGIELAYQQFFDMLPEPFDGFGIQANYTYVENKGIENTGVNSSSENGSSGSSGASDRVQVDQLEGMSKDAYNLGVFYERNKFSARLSYNWRAEYLVTVQDCCIGTPVWQDDYGQLDASLRYRINDMFELSLSGSNLTDQKAVLTQQMENSEDGGKRLKYSINQSDIRYTLGLRAQF